MIRFLAVCIIGVLISTQSAFARLPDFSELIEESSPAVVKINVVTQAKRSSRQFSAPNGQPLPEIFRRFLDPRMLEQQSRPAQSLGSGFFISKDGYVITNYHVVEGADEIIVELIDRREYTADVIGVDPRSDLALLKIEEKGLPFLKVADDSSLKVGEWVVAIGSPFGLEFSASAGIVSAKGRSIRNERGEDYVPFIQTDVAINPGNSGGPLFNMDGEVVGVNSQIYSRSGGSIGLSFAIPASVVNNVVKQLKDKGSVDRGWLGVVIQDVDRNLADSFGLERPRGALVNQMVEDGPADEGGIKVGDVILTFNGSPVNTSSDLPHLVGASSPDDKVKVELVRKGKKKVVTVKIGTLDTGNNAVGSRFSNGSKGNKVGLVVEDTPKHTAKELNIRGGVVVSYVEADSPAARAGINVGDVITDINFEDITNADTFGKIIRQLPKAKPVPIRFISNGRPVFRTIKIE